MIWKRPNCVKIWPLTLTFCMNITFVNSNDDTMRGKYWKRCDRRTDDRQDRSENCLATAKNRYLVPLDLNWYLLIYLSLAAIIDRRGLSKYCGHYATSVYCCEKISYYIVLYPRLLHHKYLYIYFTYILYIYFIYILYIYIIYILDIYIYIYLMNCSWSKFKTRMLKMKNNLFPWCQHILSTS